MGVASILAKEAVASLVPRPSAASFLVAYVTFEPLSDKLAEGLAGTTPTSFTSKVDTIGTWFHVKWRHAKSSRANGRFPSELLLAFTLPWWTTGGVRYGSPCCTVVVA